MQYREENKMFKKMHVIHVKETHLYNVDNKLQKLFQNTQKPSGVPKEKPRVRTGKVGKRFGTNTPWSQGGVTFIERLPAGKHGHSERLLARYLPQKRSTVLLWQELLAKRSEIGLRDVRSP